MRKMPNSPTYINIAFEDVLSEAVINRLLSQLWPEAVVYKKFYGRGSGYLRSHLQAFMNSSKSSPFFVLIDSDNEGCAKKLLHSLIKKAPPSDFILRIAVHEIESWVLADFNNLIKALNIKSGRCPSNTDTIIQPKEYILNLVRKSASKSIRKSLLPTKVGAASQGPGYNSVMVQFVMDKWNISNASLNSESLNRTVLCLQTFRKSRLER
jgi:hypothetical protein